MPVYEEFLLLSRAALIAKARFSRHAAQFVLKFRNQNRAAIHGTKGVRTTLPVADPIAPRQEPSASTIPIGRRRGRESKIPRQVPAANTHQCFSQNLLLRRNLNRIIEMLPLAAAAAPEEAAIGVDTTRPGFKNLFDLGSDEAFSTFHHAHPKPIARSRKRNEEREPIGHSRHAISTRRQGDDLDLHFGLGGSGGPHSAPVFFRAGAYDPAPGFPIGWPEAAFPDRGSNSMTRERPRWAMRPQTRSARRYLFAISASTRALSSRLSTNCAQ